RGQGHRLTQAPQRIRGGWEQGRVAPGLQRVQQQEQQRQPQPAPGPHGRHSRCRQHQRGQPPQHHPAPPAGKHPALEPQRGQHAQHQCGTRRPLQPRRCQQQSPPGRPGQDGWQRPTAPGAGLRPHKRRARTSDHRDHQLVVGHEVDLGGRQRPGHAVHAGVGVPQCGPGQQAPVGRPQAGHARQVRPRTAAHHDAHFLVGQRDKGAGRVQAQRLQQGRADLVQLSVRAYAGPLGCLQGRHGASVLASAQT
ncbi:MAG: hypothetical protein ACK559_27985, partial [bacterium]